MALHRRIFRREFKAALGIGDTWFRTLQNRGLVPRGRVDPGGRREWWTEAEANAAIEKIAADADAQREHEAA